MKLVIAKLIFTVDDSLAESEIDALADSIDDDLTMGLEAVGENVIEKYGDGKLKFTVEVS